MTLAKIDQILDRHTVIITGPAEVLQYYNTGERLAIILEEPDRGPGGGPLILTKGKVTVEDNMGHYVVAKTDVEEKERPMRAIRMLRMTETEEFHKDLNVREGSLRGNPANSPIKPGDPVVSIGELKEYVQKRLEEASKSQEKGEKEE